MKIIKSSFEIIEQDCSIYNKPDADQYINSCKLLNGVYKQIELAGRTCYKSYDKITETSAKEFVDRMVKSGHGAMLEHGTIYLIFNLNNMFQYEWYQSFRDNKFSKCLVVGSYTYVTTNYRVIIENKWNECLNYMCEPEHFHYKRITVKFTLPISISREFIRHRSMSFAEQSTRYCNFSKDKFNNEITVIEPYWINNPGNFTTEAYESAYEVFCSSCEEAEGQYFRLIEAGYKPQEAREVLPLCTATELVMTGYIEDWSHFFKLRCDSAAHPQARELALAVKEQIVNK